MQHIKIEQNKANDYLVTVAIIHSDTETITTYDIKVSNAGDVLHTFVLYTSAVSTSRQSVDFNHDEEFHSVVNSLIAFTEDKHSMLQDI